MKFSKEQIALLLAIHRMWQQNTKNTYATWRNGIRWDFVKRYLYGDKKLTSIERASLSRTVKRLEMKGCVIRLAFIRDGGYMTHIALTKKGQGELEKTVNNISHKELLTVGQQTKVRKPVGVAV